MLKKIVFAAVAFMLSIGVAFAQVDVNKADQAALDGIKGVGPKMSKSILDERKKGGDFKDWADLQSRVKGIGDKNSANLSQAGLTVNGKGKDAAAPAKTEKPAKVEASAKAASPSASAVASTSAVASVSSTSKEVKKAAAKAASASASASAKK